MSHSPMAMVRRSQTSPAPANPLQRECNQAKAGASDRPGSFFLRDPSTASAFANPPSLKLRRVMSHSSAETFSAGGSPTLRARGGKSSGRLVLRHHMLGELAGQLGQM